MFNRYSLPVDFNLSVFGVVTWPLCILPLHLCLSPIEIHCVVRQSTFNSMPLRGWRWWRHRAWNINASEDATAPVSPSASPPVHREEEWDGEREWERERETDRETERDRQRERECVRERLVSEVKQRTQERKWVKLEKSTNNRRTEKTEINGEGEIENRPTYGRRRGEKKQRSMKTKEKRTRKKKWVTAR